MCRFPCSRGHSWPLKNPTNVFIYGFQGVFSVLAECTYRKWNNYEWIAAGFQTFFQINLHMTMLSFGKLLCCFESSIATDEWSHMIKDFPYPVGKFTNTLLPLRNSAAASSCCGLRFWTLNAEHTSETALTLVALARDFLLPSSVNVQSLAMKLDKLFTSGE